MMVNRRRNWLKIDWTFDFACFDMLHLVTTGSMDLWRMLRAREKY